jgi:hypothetical protein
MGHQVFYFHNLILVKYKKIFGQGNHMYVVTVFVFEWFDHRLLVRLQYLGIGKNSAYIGRAHKYWGFYFVAAGITITLASMT